MPASNVAPDMIRLAALAMLKIPTWVPPAMVSVPTSALMVPVLFRSRVWLVAVVLVMRPALDARLPELRSMGEELVPDRVMEPVVALMN